MTNEQFKQVEHSFKHGDTAVIKIGERIFVCEQALKHRKEATIEFKDCYEVNDSCFEPNGEYYGDTLPNSHTIILDDHLADEPNCVETIYYDDEIREIL